MSGRNTRISYLYRDAENNKVYNEVVVEGTFTESEKDEIMSACESGEYFIPGQVSLPENRFEDLDLTIDHCWFELSRDGFEETEDRPTETIGAREVLEGFRNAARDGWRDGAELSF